MARTAPETENNIYKKKQKTYTVTHDQSFFFFLSRDGSKHIPAFVWDRFDKSFSFVPR